MGIGNVTPGTTALRQRWAPETIQSEKAVKNLEPTFKSPERAAKIAAAKRGEHRSTSVIEAIRKANIGKKASAETRRKMSEAHKRRGTVPPAMKGPLWTPEEDVLLGTMKDWEVAERIGRSEGAVSDRRYTLNVPAFTKRAPNGAPVKWTTEKDRLLGTMPDTVLARKLRCSPIMVAYRRKRLKIARYRA